jgi:hypothetical protein
MGTHRTSRRSASGWRCAAAAVMALVMVTGCESDGDGGREAGPADPPDPVDDGGYQTPAGSVEAAPEQGCEATPNTPDRLEVDMRYDAWVTVCRSTDGAILTITNVTAGSTLRVFPVKGAVDWEFSSAPMDSVGESAIASAVPAGIYDNGMALLPPRVSVTATSATPAPFTLDMVVDLRGTTTAMAAGTIGDWLESKVPQPRASRWQAMVEECATDVGAMAEVTPGAQWQDLLREAFSTQQSCTALYAAVVEEVAVPPSNVTAAADEAVDLARSSRAKNTSVWDDILKAARSGAVRLLTN